MINKILIANRGEIAVRIIKTCKKLNIRTVVVYSDLDKNALFVRMADEAYALNGVTAIDTYLNSDKIFKIAEISNADAIHPGYGFLSENSEFARQVEEKGIKFIGPSADAIAAMGMKSTAKEIVAKAGVKTVPGYNGGDNSIPALVRAAESIGFPLLIKAAAGGGGKGMRIVNHEQELLEALSAAKRESQKAFANDELILEKYLTNPRHIEVQVLCDQYGNAVHLFERDCSIQRRYQKIIEEAPAPNLSDKVRSQLGEQALAVAKAINYSGVGTIEFLLDEDDSFYFMEMNTRLQVEHPVTELITGLDLVELQIIVANNERLSLCQKDIVVNGHAIEARVYAEDIYNNFLPATGKVKSCHFYQDVSVRIDSGISVNDEVSIYYDPMLAKIIAYGADRIKAIDKLHNALLHSYIVGVKNNIEFLTSCLLDSDFQSGEVSTAFIENNIQELLSINNKSYAPVEAWLTASIYFNFIHDSYDRVINYSKAAQDPWLVINNFRLNQDNIYKLDLDYIRVESSLDNNQSGKETSIKQLAINCTGLNLNNFKTDNRIPDLTINLDDINYKCRNINIDDAVLSFNAEPSLEDTNLDLELSNVYTFQGYVKCDYLFVDHELYVFVNGKQYIFSNQIRERHLQDYQGHSKGSLNAPMHGSIVAINVNVGETVAAGDTLIILEAMKMEHAITAPREGVVTTINFSKGEQVAEGAELLMIE